MFGLVYGLKEPLFRLSVASKKSTTFLFASIVILSPCSLNTCQIFFFIIWVSPILISSLSIEKVLNFESFCVGKNFQTDQPFN